MSERVDPLPEDDELQDAFGRAGGRPRRKQKEAQQEAASEVSNEGAAAPDAETVESAGGAAAGPELIEINQIASALPRPYTREDQARTLSDKERADLRACEAALEHLRIAFWMAGRALQVIRDAGLYLETHATFEAYCLERWDMGRRQADRLIASWSLAERVLILRPLGLKIGERHVREVLPLADAYGEDAGELVLRTVAEAATVRVTADVVRGAVDAVAVGEETFNAELAVQQIRAFLAGLGTTVTAEQKSSSTGAFERQAARVLGNVGKLAERLGGAERDEVRRFVGEMRALLDQIEKQAAEEA